MKLSDYRYELPRELIAQEPSDVRDMSKLMVVDRKDESINERVFKDVIEYFSSGDVLVVNDTKVIPARLIGRKKTGGKVEVFLLEKVKDKTWKCLVNPGKRLQVGAEIMIDGISAKIIDRTPSGERIIEFDSSDSEIFNVGEIPLPPYIQNDTVDRNRYQTVYAEREGAVAAPTAGLHFTPDLLSQIKKIGVKILKITLHVGIGTFRPIKTDNVDDHKMDFEWYKISDEIAGSINETKKNGGKIFACGTTVVRTLESNVDENGKLVAGSGKTDLFIKPGFQYKVVDKLITNFHLPGSTLLLLVSAFSNRELMLRAYQQAINSRFRFFSFGDAMLIL